MALSTVLRCGASRSVHMSACENHALLQNLGHHFVALGKDSLQIPRHKQHKILPRDQLSGLSSPKNVTCLELHYFFILMNIELQAVLG